MPEPTIAVNWGRKTAIPRHEDDIPGPPPCNIIMAGGQWQGEYATDPTKRPTLAPPPQESRYGVRCGEPNERTAEVKASKRGPHA